MGNESRPDHFVVAGRWILFKEKIELKAEFLFVRETQDYFNRAFVIITVLFFVCKIRIKNMIE